MLCPGADAAKTCEAQRAAHGADVVSVHCGRAPSAVLDAEGRLWVTFVQNQHVYVARSDDLGESYTPPVPVNPTPEDAEHNGENRPKIVLARSAASGGDTAAGGEPPIVLLTWTRKTSRHFTGEIRFSRSIDGGESFSPPRVINDDGLFAGHRFDSLHVTESGRLFVTWIDKRDLEAATARDEPYPGAAIYYAVSDDLGASFTRNYRVAHNSCECCRIAVAPNGPDGVAILWRHIFDGGVRDHALAVLGGDGTVTALRRATVDDWRIDACPHHGPAMIAAARAGQYHMSWFSAGTRHSGIHYGRYDLAAGAVRDIHEVDAAPGASHPHLARHADSVYLVWKRFDGQATELELIVSRDDGATWSAPRVLRSTQLASDHPLLVESAQGVLLSWWTEEFGYVVERISRDIEEPAHAAR